ncbi:TPA: hypothetical protein EYG96_01335 [Candidatus Gracilibacteria bacterium]|nr:hypothetical protein [Candidatus Gracilibacteria bacterium]
MDFSPYKKSKYNSFLPDNTKPQSKAVKYIYLTLSIAVGVGAVWFLQSLFGTNDGISAYATFEKETAVAESQMKDVGIWSVILNNHPITEGETVHIKKENDAKIRLPDTSFFSLGEESEVSIEKLRKTKNGELFGNIIINKSPILFSGKTHFNKEEELKIFIAENIYVAAGKNTFLFQDNIVSFIDGEKIWVGKLGENGKIQTSREFGIGQSLNIITFTKIPTESILQSSQLVAQYKGEKLEELSEKDTREENLDIPSPVLLFPEFDSTAIIVTNGKQKIKGTASLDTEKIIIVFSNGTNKEELTFIPILSDNEKIKEWSYTASKQYKTILSGINSYKIYAVNKENQRSIATTLKLSYNPENTDETEENNETEEETNEEDATTNFIITAPNQGRDTQIEGDTIILNGVSSTNVAYITISNMTLNSSYTLQKYKKGQKTWKYWIDELQPDTYEYIVYAKDENKKILSTQKISITLTAPKNTATPQPTTTTTTTMNPTATASTQISATPAPVVTTGANTSPPATPTPQPTITSSTAEVSR